MSKPDKHLDWCVGNPQFSQNVIEPSNAKKQAGWAASEAPPYEIVNYLFNKIDEWQKYFDSQLSENQQGYDAVIGNTAGDPAATHDTLADAIADVDVGPNSKIFVKQSLNISSIINLTKAGWRIEFAPGVTYTKSGVANCLNLDAEGIQILHGRFSGWDGVSDAAIKLSANASYCHVMASRFSSSTTQEVDDSLVGAGKKPSITATITEVP